MRTKRATRLEFQPPAFGDEEVAAVAEVVRSGWIGPGPKVELLERRVAGLLEAEHVVAVSSCTVALQLALLAVGVGPGDEVVTSTMTWPATANAIEACGARPVFCDVREDDLDIDSTLVAELLTERTKAIVPVHFAGQPADVESLRAYVHPVVEDAAHAFGARRRGRPPAAITDAACFSLYVTKHVAAGEGGLVVTRRPDLAERVRGMRRVERSRDGRYDQTTRALKAGLPDLFASIALAQLDKLERFHERRRRQFALYDEGLSDLAGIGPLARDPDDVHARHLYVVRIDPEQAGGTRDDYQRGLSAELIATSIHFLPVHRLTWFRERYPDQPALPVAERVSEEVLSLPLSPAHDDDDIRDAIDAVRTLHSRFTA